MVNAIQTICRVTAQCRRTTRTVSGIRVRQKQTTIRIKLENPFPVISSLRRQGVAPTKFSNLPIKISCQELCSFKQVWRVRHKTHPFAYRRYSPMEYISRWKTLCLTQPTDPPNHTAHKRLLTGIQSKRSTSTISLKTISTRYLVKFWILVSLMLETLIEGESIVCTNHTCWSACTTVQTLKAFRFRSGRGLIKCELAVWKSHTMLFDNEPVQVSSMILLRALWINKGGKKRRLGTEDTSWIEAFTFLAKSMFQLIHYRADSEQIWPVFTTFSRDESSA